MLPSSAGLFNNLVFSLQEVEGRLEELMLDVFGNYVVQRLLDHGDTTIQQTLVEKVIKSEAAL